MINLQILKAYISTFANLQIFHHYNSFYQPPNLIVIVINSKESAGKVINPYLRTHCFIIFFALIFY